MSNKKPTVSKTELVNDIADKTNLSKSQIKEIFDVLVDVVESYIKSGNAVTIPNLVKIYVHKKKASAARQMKSPATGELIMVAAKPARKVVKVKPVKSLKELL
jgi:nucleoid DNA-binding protein